MASKIYLFGSEEFTANNYCTNLYENILTNTVIYINALHC